MMKYIFIFLSLINCCYFFNEIQATAEHQNVTEGQDNVYLTVLNHLKADNQILKLRLENLEVKQTNHFEILHKKLNTLENHKECSNRSSDVADIVKPAESADNVITKFVGDEEPLMCIKDTSENIICSNVSLPTTCAASNSMNCWENKCRIQNRLLGSKSFLINCVDRKREKGWTTIQRRIDGSISFHQNWTMYKNGFGDIDGNYWIGLEKLYALTILWAPVELLVVLEDCSNDVKFAKYDAFAIGDESTNYAIKILGNYSGTAGDSLIHHKGAPFTTHDRDNDKVPTRNCADTHRGGWWYTACFACNLNGRYYENSQPPRGYHQGIHWDGFRGVDYSLKKAEMLIRPKPSS